MANTIVGAIEALKDVIDSQGESALPEIKN